MKTIHGYSEAKIEIKAKNRKMTPDEYINYLDMKLRFRKPKSQRKREKEVHG